MLYFGIKNVHKSAIITIPFNDYYSYLKWYSKGKTLMSQLKLILSNLRMTQRYKIIGWKIN